MSEGQPINPEDQTVNTGPPLPAESAEINYFLAVLLGTAAAAVSAGVWYGLVVMTGWMIGYIAIGIGFLVGIAVKYGAGRGAMALQVLGAALSLIAIFAGDYPIIHYWIRLESPEFTEWLGLGAYIDIYIGYLKEEPITLPS